jgi:glycosyltransferase involved in cell wall biosynthesis
MHGQGARYLERALQSLDAQTHRDVEAIVADHSADDALAELCRARRQRYPLRYLRNPHGRGSSSANTNCAVRHAGGEIVKILHQDDFFHDPQALHRIARAMAAAPGRSWGGVGCVHTDAEESGFFGPHMPSVTPRLAVHNTFGAPSLLFVRRAAWLPCDEGLIWMMDCEHYHRLRAAFGEPILIHEPLIANRRWARQVTHTLATRERRDAERRYVMEKHGLG